MHSKLLRSGGLLILMFFFVHQTAANDSYEPSDYEKNYDSYNTYYNGSDSYNSSSNSYNSSSKSYNNSYSSDYGNGYRDTYGQDMVGYDSRDSYGDRNSYYSSEPDGYDGLDPDRYGQDYADKKKIYNPRDSMAASLDVWIRAADDWESDLKYRNRAPYGNDKYGKNKYPAGKSNDAYKGSRKKRSYKQVRFPVRQYRDVKRFPLNRFPPLFSTFPWLPIFYDKITYQTFIFSPTGGIYVLPPLVNFFGRRFAVAQLIKWGYASLVSTGVPPPPNVNIAPLIQPVPGPGVPGVPGAPPVPSLDYNAQNGQYNGGVTTDFTSFRPRTGDYSQKGY